MIDLNYGVLDFKLFEKDNRLVLVTANSNDTFSFFKVSKDDKLLELALIKNIELDSLKTDTCNVVEHSGNTLLFGNNDGTIKAFDYNKESFVCISF